jgi:hypothetical protein
MKSMNSRLFVALAVLTFVPIVAAQEMVDVAAIGSYSMTEDWEGEPFGNEWDDGYNFGAEANVELLGLWFGGRFTLGDFDVNGIETNLEETWSQTNLELYGGYKLLGTPVYLMAGYRKWELDLSESNVSDSLTFSFDGIGVGGAVKWNAPASNLFFNVQGMYFFEVDSSLDELGPDGFDYLLSLKGEVGMEIASGFYGAVGIQFEQVHQNLPLEDRVEPFVDYGFEQTSITAKVGYRFSL